MSIINKIRNNLYFIIGCIILIIILILLYQIRSVSIIEGLESIPRYEYTPLTPDNREFYLSSPTYSALNLVPYDSDINVQEFLERNQNRFHLDIGSGIIYTKGVDNKIYAFGSSDSPLTFIRRSEPTTFLRSIGTLLNSDTQLPSFTTFFEYDNKVINLTIQQEESTQQPSSNSSDDRITINDIKQEFRISQGRYEKGACYIMDQKYRIRPNNLNNIPRRLRSYWNRNNCDRLISNTNSARNVHNEYINKFKTVKSTYVANYKKEVTIILNDRQIEYSIALALKSKYPNLYLTNDEFTRIKITVPDKSINIYAVEVTKVDGKIDVINISFNELIQPMISTLFNSMNIVGYPTSSQIQTIIQRFETNIQSIRSNNNDLNDSRFSYISGYVIYDNTEYPVIVQTRN